MRKITSAKTGNDRFLSKRDRDVLRAQIEGYNMGVLAGLVVLNDFFDFTDEEMVLFRNGCRDVVSSISDGTSNAVAINRELRRIIGEGVLENLELN